LLKTKEVIMYNILILSLLLTISFIQAPANAASNLKLNPNLNYTSDSNDGPLITGDNITDGVVHTGKPAYIIFYHNECYNSKRQAKRTVELYEKYQGKVDFIIVDLDSQISSEQSDLRVRFYRRYIPHVTIIDGKGKVLYNRSGEIGTDTTSAILDKALM
jgi:thioredoxin-related protein